MPLLATVRTPEGGSCVEVIPGIFWLRMPMPFALDHVNLWLLEEEDGWTLIDCGLGNDQVKELWASVADHCFKKRPLKRVIVTHFHADHLGLAAWLVEQHGAQLLMSEGEYRAASKVYAGSPGWGRSDSEEFLRSCGVSAAQISRSALGPQEFRSGVPDLPGEYERIGQGTELQNNGRTWQVLTASGHSPEHVSLYCPELEVLISGDQVLGQISSNVSVWPHAPDADPLNQYLESLTMFASLPRKALVLPAHGRPFYDLHQRLAELQVHHQARLHLVKEGCRRSCSVVDLLPTLFERPLDDQQLHFAVGEALAHLNYLWRKGDLSRELNSEFKWLFKKN